jgi:hypothetical protein
MPADPRIVELYIARQRLARRDAPLIGRHQIRGPEPDRQWKFGVVKNGPGCAHRGQLNPSGQRHPADNLGRPPRSQIDAGIRADSQEMTGAPRPYATACRLLKQPDQQKLPHFLTSSLPHFYRPPRPVRSLSDQSNGLKTTLNWFFSRNSRSVVRRLGWTNARMARSIGLRATNISGALPA